MDDNDDVVSYAIHKLLNPTTNRVSDLSGNGYGNDYQRGFNDEEVVNDNPNDDESVDEPVLIDRDRYICVHERLIVHFNIAIQQNKVQWPKHNNK